MSSASKIDQEIRPRILLAEDSEDDAFFFERSLKKTCIVCDFERAANGKVAIELLQKNAGQKQFHLVFLDLKMPVMSGFEALEFMRSGALSAVPKVIVLSGSNDHTDRDRAMELGAADYIVKPITAAVLRDRLNAITSEAQGGAPVGEANR